MKKIIIRFFQLLILLTVRLSYIGRIKLEAGRLDGISGPVVIASNHANSMDPFIIACFLPLKTIFKVFPYAFMTANVYYYGWWKPLAFLAGCYPAKVKYDKEPSNKYGVGKSVELLKEGYSVVMFPEGRRTTTQIDAKPGISHILNGYQAPLVLCHIYWDRSGKRELIRMTIEPAPEGIDINNPNSIIKAAYNLPLPQEAVLVDKKA
jgi:1-acyl-sn-glycerol-3-phosphate acyltransferase